MLIIILYGFAQKATTLVHIASVFYDTYQSIPDRDH